MSTTIKIEAISEDGARGLIAILNEVIQVEYGIIINYPRMIDYFVNVEKFNDETFLSDLEKIGV